MATTLTAPRKSGRPFKGTEKINVPEALKLRLRGWTFEQLAEKYGCAHASVQSALKRFTDLVPNPEIRQAYQESKADILEGVQHTLMASMLHPDKLGKATLGNVAYAASKLDEMIRLERGQSTKNVNVLSMLVDKTHRSLFASSAASVDALPAQEEEIPAKLNDNKDI